jgi:hypothetical protein
MKHDLDINTPAGQKTLEQERSAMQKYLQHHPELSIVETLKTTDAKADGMLVKGGTICGVYEVKCRNMTEEQLRQYGSWLITNRKLQHGKTLSTLLRVPYFGILYLVPDDRIYVWMITDEEGRYTFEFSKERTLTRRCVSGGTAFRENAFLDIKNIHEVII